MINRKILELTCLLENPETIVNLLMNNRRVNYHNKLHLTKIPCNNVLDLISGEDFKYIYHNNPVWKYVFWQPKNTNFTACRATNNTIWVANFSHSRYDMDSTYYYSFTDKGDDCQHLGEGRYFQHLGKEGERVVYAINEYPSWTFYEKGTPLPFEQLDHYNYRLKKKRLTEEMICDYMNALGYPIDDEKFFETDMAYVIENTVMPTFKILDASPVSTAK